MVALAAILLAAGSAAQAPASKEPIFVTGHAWAPFISPMGEPFRARTADDDTLIRWFNQADANHDGMLTFYEMQADANRFFAKLDTDHDGEIDPDELAQYEWDIAPDIQVMSRTRPAPGHVTASNNGEAHRAPGHWRPGAAEEDEMGSTYPHGLQGAARYAILNLPEPVAAADSNFDRSITLLEFRQAAADRFELLDASRAGSLTLAQLQALRPTLATDRHRHNDKDVPDARLGSPLPPGN